MQDKFTFPFQKLEVWKEAVDLADDVFKLLEAFPQNKHFRLIGQMESAVSSFATQQILILGGRGKDIDFTPSLISCVHVGQAVFTSKNFALLTSSFIECVCLPLSLFKPSLTFLTTIILPSSSDPFSLRIAFN